MKRFNDDFYFKSINEWEEKVVPARARSNQIGWCLRLVVPALIVGSALSLRNWQTWLAIFSVVYVVAGVFTFLEELNENVRFVRHQLKAFREGVRRVSAEVSTYKDPERNFTLAYALSSIDREWEDPEGTQIDAVRASDGKGSAF